MLSKRICQRCYRKHSYVWGKTADEDWEKCSLVSCHDYFAYSWGNGWDIMKNAPSWCPFALEHLMETQNELSETLLVNGHA